MYLIFEIQRAQLQDDEFHSIDIHNSRYHQHNYLNNMKHSFLKLIEIEPLKKEIYDNNSFQTFPGSPLHKIENIITILNQYGWYIIDNKLIIDLYFNHTHPTILQLIRDYKLQLCI